MKMKLIATLALLAVAAGVQAANVSVNNISIIQGTATVDVPVLIAPSGAGETIGAMNISFAAGDAGDAIPILNSGTEFDGSIWDSGTFFGAAGTGVNHSALSAVAMINPLRVAANGTLITYTLDTSSLPVGTYVLDPDFQIGGVGSSGDPSFGIPPGDPINPIAFANGTLTVNPIPEPATIGMTAVFAVLGLGVFLKRRRA
jgi:hypothetical protein